MTTGRAFRIEERGYLAAIRRFPNSELAIRRLISQSETFRDICGELAEAESVLSTFPEAASRESYAVRRQEWQEVVDRLVSEVAASLRRAKRQQTSPDQRRPGAREEE
jgi:hypothetical protein